MPEEKEGNVAILAVEVHPNPRTTLAALEAEVCRFLNHLAEFYKEKDMDDEACFYSVGVMIHATIGLGLAIKSPKLFEEITAFMEKKSKENIETAVHEAAELLKELMTKGEN